MKRISSSLLVAVFMFGATAFAEPFWANRPGVIRAADKLAEEVERLEEALHAVHAPAHFVGKVHHFEETVMEFASEVRTCTYQEANQEMNHIRQDVSSLRSEFAAHPQLLANFQVYNEWKHVRTAYRYLDHEMTNGHFGGGHNRMNRALKKDLAELESAHK